MAIIKTVGQDNKLHCEFNSVGEVFRIIERMGWTPRNAEASDYRGTDGGFYTFGSLGEAVGMFRDTPDKIRDFDLNDVLLESKSSAGKEVEFDITGDYLDIDRYLEGIPEVFGNAVMGNPKNIFCTINILTSYVASTEASYLIARQKRILRLVDWLENQGIRCQIVTTSSTGCLFSRVVVKEFQDPVSLNDLAVVSHPDFLRRILFLISEQSDTWEHGYGSSIDYDAKMSSYESKPEDGLYIYVGGYLPPSESKMNTKFDYIENYVQNMLDVGMSYNDEKLNLTERG